MDMAFNVVTRGQLPAISGYGVPRAMEANQHGDLIVSQNLPERAMCVSRANSWIAQPLVAQASTFLVAQPTTAFATALVNNDPLLTYIIDRVTCWAVTSMAAAQPASILAALVPPGNPISTLTGTVLAPANIFSLANKAGSYTGNAVVKGAGAITALPAVGAGSWFTLGTGLIAAPTTNLGLALEALCYGRYLVRPGGAFCTNAIAGTAAGTFVMAVEWHEALLPLN